MTRIKEVAALAGVSTATVSRVLNGKSVSPGMESAVRRAVAELGYTPNRTARSLRRQHSELIALVLPDIENPFFTSLARGVEDVARAAGLSVVLCNTDEDVDTQEHYLRIADDENMAGVILAPAGPSALLARLAERHRAVVVVDRAVPDDVDQVLFDNVDLGRRAAQALVDRGHRRVACITGPRATPTAKARADGWREALHEKGLPAPDDLLVYANYRVDGGETAMAQLLAAPEPPEAVLATNNLVGVGALRVLAAGDGPHAQLGIIGDLPFVTSPIDDTFLLQLHPREMGLMAARMLVDRIRGEAGPAQRVIQPSRPVMLGAPAS
ncbi:LacI family DNA-binding transcriptional regulator [Promicromonospora panici]|uniref:LacI family DNA-binding transcriptional regulator n=1 Tax=Promicromonospora panici TaxID=2219658 RepID=UPI00101C5E42|nr:LacI family DNA-binding transcriptional regulator [Promicromonospora panici]